MSEMIYPLNLIDCEAFTALFPYVVNNNLKSQFEKARKTSGNQEYKEIQSGIFLPIPKQGVGTTDSHVLEDIVGGTNITGIIGSAAMQGFKEALGFVAQLNSGVAVNQRIGQMWKGISLRTYSLSWDFIPETENEAKKLREIINQIRINELPQYGANNLIDYPSIWVLKYIVKGKLLYGYDALMLSEFKVNNDLNDQTTFFDDGMPVKTSLDLTFTEIKQNGIEVQKEFIGF